MAETNETELSYDKLPDFNAAPAVVSCGACGTPVYPPTLVGLVYTCPCGLPGAASVGSPQAN